MKETREKDSTLILNCGDTNNCMDDNVDWAGEAAKIAELSWSPCWIAFVIKWKHACACIDMRFL
jgi:hypothetical protein